MLVTRGMFDDEWIPTAVPDRWRRFIRFSYEEPRFGADLVIHSVSSYSLRGAADIGGAYISTITYGGSRLTIDCTPPLTIEALTPAIRVELRITDEMVDQSDASLIDLESLGVAPPGDLDTEFWKQVGAYKANVGRLSLAHCFCLALTARMSPEIVTSDHEFDAVAELGICPVRFVR